MKTMLGLPPNSSRGRIIIQRGCPPEVEIYGSDNGRNVDFRVQYHTIEDKASFDPIWAGVGIAKALYTEFILEQRSTMLLDWIRNCDKHHPRCKLQIDTSSKLPSRVLDVEARTDKSVVHLDTRSTKCEDNKYMTLSHCWGKFQIIQTRNESLETRMKHIEWDVLPKTFQDAIAIAQAIGIRYLWIDSLCIIQNDELDWKQESANMANIYSNSYLNIAATGSADGRGGCLSPRSIKCGSTTSNVESILIKTSSPNQPDIFVRASLENVHYRFSTQIKHYSTLQDAESVPLLSRAWVFQERYLAPRTLHFHPTEVILECKTCLRCECTGLDPPPPKFGCESHARETLPAKSSDNKERYDNWLRVIEEFTRLSLTRQSDRLIALIGVATVFQAQLDDDYIAGLWKGDLVRGLLWQIAGPSKSLLTQPHEEALAPTWSWASLVLVSKQAGIVFPAGHDDSFMADGSFEFVQSSISSDAKSSSASAHGLLQVRGAVLTAIIWTQTTSIFQISNTLLIFDREVEGDFILISTSVFKPDIQLPENALDISDTESLVYCLILGSTIDSSTAETRVPEIQPEFLCTLVLRSEGAGRHKRLGVLNVSREVADCQFTEILELEMV